MSEPLIVQPGQGRRLDLGNFEVQVLAGGADAPAEFTLLQTEQEQTDFGPPLHLHRDAAESFFVLEGEYLVYVGDATHVCPPGTFVYVPRNTPHTFKVTSGPGKKLVLFTPPAMLGFFEELAAAEAVGTPSPEELSAISERNAMQVLGPVPETYL